MEQYILPFSAIAVTLLVLVSCAPRQSTSSPNVSWSIQPNTAAATPASSWDLTYTSVLRANGIGPDSLLWEWAELPSREPIKALISEWRDELIVSSILIELPGPEGDQNAFWFARTSNHAFHWQFENGKLDEPHVKQPVSVEKYDEAFKVMSAWEQAPSSGQEGITGSYYGFLSLYDRGKSRQMLLTIDDLGKADRPGRLLPVFGKLLENL